MGKDGDLRESKIASTITLGEPSPSMSIMEHICPSLIYVTVSVYRLPMFAGGHDNLIDAARALLCF